ncbi:unnamed protein product, partial [Rotaria sordida]
LNARNDAGYTPLLTAAFYEANDCFQYLLEIRDIKWMKRNDDGETVLHILAKSKNHPDSPPVIRKKLGSKDKKDVMMIRDNADNTPLHTAVCSNQLAICEELVGVTNDNTTPSASKNIIGKKNALGQTAIHVACKMGHIAIVKYFWEVTGEDPKGELSRRDDDRQSCLHLAAAESKSIDNL